MHSGFRTYRWLNLEIWWGLIDNKQFAYYPRLQLWWAGKQQQEEQDGSFRVLVHNKTQVKQYTHTPLTHKFSLILFLLWWSILLHYVLVIFHPWHAWHCIHSVMQPLFCIWGTARPWWKWGCHTTFGQGGDDVWNGVLYCRRYCSGTGLPWEGGSLEWESFFPLSEGIKLQLFCSGWLLDAIQDFCFTRAEMLNSSLLEGIYFEKFSLQILFYCPAIRHLWCSQNLV